MSLTIAVVASTIRFALIWLLAVRAALIAPAPLVAAARINWLWVAGGSSATLILAFILALFLAATVDVLVGFAVFPPVSLAGIRPTLAVPAVAAAGSVFRSRSVLVPFSGSLSFARSIAVMLRVARRSVCICFRCPVVTGPHLA
jgi:hypothetical protein